MYQLDPPAVDRVIAGIETALNCRPDVQFGVIFGSFIERNRFRDVDLGVWTTETAGSRVDVDLAARLSEELGLPIDVRLLNKAPVPFLFHALRGRAVTVRDERLLAELMERTAREYHDRAPLLQRATREAFAG